MSTGTEQIFLRVPEELVSQRLQLLRLILFESRFPQVIIALNLAQELLQPVKLVKPEPKLAKTTSIQFEAVTLSTACDELVVLRTQMEQAIARQLLGNATQKTVMQRQLSILQEFSENDQNRSALVNSTSEAKRTISELDQVHSVLNLLNDTSFVGLFGTEQLEEWGILLAKIKRGISNHFQQVKPEFMLLLQLSELEEISAVAVLSFLSNLLEPNVKIVEHITESFPRAIGKNQVPVFGYIRDFLVPALAAHPDTSPDSVYSNYYCITLGEISKITQITPGQIYIVLRRLNEKLLEEGSPLKIFVNGQQVDTPVEFCFFPTPIESN